ncbi:MAG: phosphopantetheine-binding protein [Pseudomonadota bacterium]
MELREEILEKLINRTAHILKRNPAELTEAMSFMEDLKAKSVNMVQIITFLEDELDIEIPLMQIRKKKTIGEAADFLTELCSI